MTIRLFVSDPHFTNKPLDEYRWALFPQLLQWIDKYQVEELWILGDLTDAKEGHDAIFVNRLTDAIAMLAEIVPVVILRGNHDYLVKECAFFEFLRKIDGVYWIDKPTVLGEVICFPHSKNPKEEWKTLMGNLDDYEFAVFHQCFLGSKTSLGHILEGADFDLSHLKNCKPLAGDIHLPQTVRGIEYVGSPYPTTFGDRFLGRCLLFRDGVKTQLHMATIQKCTLEISKVPELYEARLYPDDQVKVRFNLSKEDRAEWTNIKQAIKDACKDLGVVLGGIELLSDTTSKVELRESIKENKKTSEVGVLERFAANADLPEDYLDVARDIMGDSCS